MILPPLGGGHWNISRAVPTLVNKTVFRNIPRHWYFITGTVKPSNQGTWHASVLCQPRCSQITPGSSTYEMACPRGHSHADPQRAVCSGTFPSHLFSEPTFAGIVALLFISINTLDSGVVCLQDLVIIEHFHFTKWFPLVLLRSKNHLSAYVPVVCKEWSHKEYS